MGFGFREKRRTLLLSTVCTFHASPENALRIVCFVLNCATLLFRSSRLDLSFSSYLAVTDSVSGFAKFAAGQQQSTCNIGVRTDRRITVSHHHRRWCLHALSSLLARIRCTLHLSIPLKLAKSYRNSVRMYLFVFNSPTLWCKNYAGPINSFGDINRFATPYFADQSAESAISTHCTHSIRCILVDRVHVMEVV